MTKSADMADLKEIRAILYAIEDRATAVENWQRTDAAQVFDAVSAVWKALARLDNVLTHRKD